MSRKEDELNFWTKWLEADPLNRREIINNLPVFDVCVIKDKNLRKISLASFLNGYFEDLESALYLKIAKEKKNNE